MFNAFLEWLTRNWNIIVEGFIWAVSAITVYIVAAKIYKIAKFKFELMDVASLTFAGVWVFLIIFFGFDHIREYLQSFL